MNLFFLLLFSFGAGDNYLDHQLCYAISSGYSSPSSCSYLSDIPTFSLDQKLAVLEEICRKKDTAIMTLKQEIFELEGKVKFKP